MPATPSRPDTPRLRLADLCLEDLVAWREWFLAEDPRRVTCRPVPDPDPERALQTWTERQQQGTGGSYAVRAVQDGRLVGRISFFDFNPRNGAVEIGFVIAPAERRKGYAREAVRLLLDLLFGERGIRKVMAQTGSFNLASLGLLLSLGFREDGRLREHHVLDGVYFDDVVLSLLAREWWPSELDFRGPSG